jgi:hypothetical protein
MAVIQKTQTGFFTAATGADIEVELEFADGQKASWDAKLQGRKAEWTGDDKNVTPFTIGKGADVKGKVLEVTAFITDVSPTTNRLFHKVHVRAPGSKELEFEFDSDPKDPGESALYTSMVMFA